MWFGSVCDFSMAFFAGFIEEEIGRRIGDTIPPPATQKDFCKKSTLFNNGQKKSLVSCFFFNLWIFVLRN